jgi:hypothetical protein
MIRRYRQHPPGILYTSRRPPYVSIHMIDGIQPRGVGGRAQSSQERPSSPLAQRANVFERSILMDFFQRPAACRFIEEPAPTSPEEPFAARGRH